jgi:hypothetical protein
MNAMFITKPLKNKTKQKISNKKNRTKQKTSNTSKQGTMMRLTGGQQPLGSKPHNWVYLKAFSSLAKGIACLSYLTKIYFFVNIFWITLRHGFEALNLSLRSRLPYAYRPLCTGTIIDSSSGDAFCEMEGDKGVTTVCLGCWGFESHAQSIALGRSTFSPSSYHTVFVTLRKREVERVNFTKPQVFVVIFLTKPQVF